MPNGTMERGGSSDSACNDDKEPIASPTESRSSSSNYTQDSAREQQTLYSSGAGARGEKTQENKSHESGGYDEKHTSEFNDWSPQSVDDGRTTSHESLIGEKTYGSQESGLNEESTASKKKSANIENFEWTPYAELHLLNSLRGLRPVGANFHFYISVVHDRFNTAMGIELPRSELLKKIDTYYNFDEALKICGEDIPTNQIPFQLPKDEFPAYAELLKQKYASKKTDGDGDSSKKKSRGQKK